MISIALNVSYELVFVVVVVSTVLYGISLSSLKHCNLVIERKSFLVRLASVDMIKKKNMSIENHEQIVFLGQVSQFHTHI